MSGPPNCIQEGVHFLLGLDRHLPSGRPRRRRPVVLVGGLTLAVSTADGLRERRRAHAALVALGTPLRVLRRSVLLQVAVPLVLSVATAVLVAAVASALYLRFAAIDDGEVLPLPWAGYGVIALAAVVASLLATTSALPLCGQPGARTGWRCARSNWRRRSTGHNRGLNQRDEYGSPSLSNDAGIIGLPRVASSHVRAPHR